MDKKDIVRKLKTQIARLTNDTLEKEYGIHGKEIKRQEVLLGSFNPDTDAYKQVKGKIIMSKLIQKLVMDEVMRRQT